MQEQGPVSNIRIFWSDLIFTASPEHIKLTLVTDFENYVKGWQCRNARTPTLTFLLQVLDLTES